MAEIDVLEAQTTTNSRCDVLLVQDDSAQQVRVVEASEGFAAVINCSVDALAGQILQSMLGNKACAYIEDTLTYEPGEADIAEILRNCRHFSLKTASGTEVVATIKIQPVGMHEGLPAYHMRVQIENAVPSRRKTEATLAMRLGLQPHTTIDTQTGLPMREAFAQDVSAILAYMKKEKANATVAFVMLNTQHDAYAGQALAKVGAAARLALRREDIVTIISAHGLGIVLLDATEETALMPLNRIRRELALQHIALADGQVITPVVTMQYHMLSKKDSAEKLLEKGDALENSRSNNTMNVLTKLG